MLRTPSIFGPLNSGFVPFSPGAPADASVDEQTAEVIARAAAPALETSFRPASVWLPASSARIRVVEGLVLVAICGYFGIGLLRTLLAL